MTNERALRRVKLVFAVLIFLSAAVIALAFTARPFGALLISDQNFETFNNLPPEQTHSIFFSIGSVVVFYILLLVVSNLIWIAGAWYLVSRFKKKEDHPPDNLPTPT
jgi:hypothetical protein